MNNTDNIYNIDNIYDANNSEKILTNDEIN